MSARNTLAFEAVDPHVRGRFGKPYRFEPECESTQALLFEPGLPEGAVAATDHQTAGRGRLGRTWEAPPGSSVLASVLLHPPPTRHWPELALLGGVAAAEAIEGATELSAQVKWPNDVMLDRRKVAGVLAESRGGVVVLGIGINVNQTRSELPLDAPTEPGSLRTDHGPRARRRGAARLTALPARAPVRRVASRRSRGDLRRARLAQLPLRPARDASTAAPESAA